jgi:transposase
LTQPLPELDAWLNRAVRSLAAAFSNGTLEERDAAQAAITTAWSTGQTEAQNCKRPMYGRRKIDLLQSRGFGLA